MLEFLTLISPATITVMFICLCVFLFLLGLFCHIVNKVPSFIEIVPNQLTSIGILGTFFGIVIGLIDFQLVDIDQSIARLLEGLKTAFITSIAGIALSILFKLVTSLFSHRNPAAVKDEDQYRSTNDIGLLLAENNRLQAIMIDNIGNQTNALDALKTGLKAELTEIYSTAIVKELSRVVDNFNKHVQTQFGENLSSLSDTLQHFHKQIADSNSTLTNQLATLETYEELMSEFFRNLTYLQDTPKLLEKFYQDTSTHMEEIRTSISPVVSTFNEQISVLSESSKHLNVITRQLAQSLPTIDDKMMGFEKAMHLLSTELTSDIQQNNEHFLANVQEQNQQLASSINGFNEHLVQSQQQVVASIETLNQAAQEIYQQTKNSNVDVFEEQFLLYKENLTDMVAQQQSLHSQLHDSLEQNIASLIDRLSLTTDSNISRIQALMSREIEEVFSHMGQALASVSGEFTRDYQLLIEQNQSLLAQAKASPTVEAEAEASG